MSMSENNQREKTISEAIEELRQAGQELIHETQGVVNDISRAIEDISMAIHHQIETIRENMKIQEKKMEEHTVERGTLIKPPPCGAGIITDRTLSDYVTTEIADFMRMAGQPVEMMERQSALERIGREAEQRSKEISDLYRKEAEKKRLRDSWKKPKGKQKQNYF